VLVNASYQNNDPIGDPSVYTPMRLITPPEVILRAAKQLPGAIAEGIENVSGDGDESTAGTFAGDVRAGGTGAAAPVDAPSTLEPPTSPGSKPAITEALAAARGSVSRPVTKPAGKPVEKSDVESVVTPLSRPGLNFSPRKPGALPGAQGRGAAGRGGPISQLVKSVFGPKQAPSPAPEASDPPQPGAAGE